MMAVFLIISKVVVVSTGKWYNPRTSKFRFLLLGPNSLQCNQPHLSYLFYKLKRSNREEIPGFNLSFPIPLSHSSLEDHQINWHAIETAKRQDCNCVTNRGWFQNTIFLKQQLTLPIEETSADDTSPASPCKVAYNHVTTSCKLKLRKRACHCSSDIS